jgi:tRNA(Ile)-lysidine synthase
VSSTKPGEEVAAVLEPVRAAGLLGSLEPVVVMLSGGRDSTCLIDVAVTLRGREAVSALHVNYGLRDDADADERHCAELCETLGVELTVVRARADDDARGNLQAWAREVRYSEASRIAGESAALIASGHTASDQVETILYRLAASPGRRALLGMQPSDHAEWGQPLVRPLLSVTREQTAAYCRARGLAWREDQSNENLEFARARVRVGVVPALRAVHPAAEANVLRTALLLREEAELLDSLVEAELAGARSIPIERLQQLPPALQRLVVVRLAEDAVGAYVPQAGARVGEIIELGRRHRTAELHLGGQAAAVIGDGVLTMARLPPRAHTDRPS